MGVTIDLNTRVTTIRKQCPFCHALYAFQSSLSKHIQKKHDDVSYTVTLITTSCDCRLNCRSCGTCVHMYICSCVDNAVHFTMCKHAHLVHLQRSVTDGEESHTDEQEVSQEKNHTNGEEVSHDEQEGSQETEMMDEIEGTENSELEINEYNYLNALVSLAIVYIIVNYLLRHLLYCTLIASKMAHSM